MTGVPGRTAVPLPRGLPSTMDEGILATPFYERRHRDLARRAVDWADGHGHLWSGPDPDPDRPEWTCRRILRALGEDGWFAFLDPGPGADTDGAVEAGPDGDFRSLCLVREALAYADDLADFAFAVQTLSAMPILRHGTAAQRRRWLPGMARGELSASFCLSEEGAGSDVSSIALRAERSGDGWVLDGSKAWVSNGSIADLHCVIARSGEGPGALGLTAFLVPADTPGVRVREEIAMIAPRAFAHLSFDGCRLPADAVLGRPGRGFAVTTDLLDRFRTTVGGAALGFARRAADSALHRARQRPMRDGHLFDLPTVKATFADMEVKLNAAALLVARAGWEIDRGNRRFAKHSSIAKLHATEVAQEVVDASVQVFGAAGLVTGSVPERLYRQVRALRLYEGASEIQQMVIASMLDVRRADLRGC